MCYLSNSSGGAMFAGNDAILEEDGSKSPLSFDSCTGRTIQPWASCALIAPITAAGAHSCYLQPTGFQGTGTNVHGVLEIWDANEDVLTAVPLQP